MNEKTKSIIDAALAMDASVTDAEKQAINRALAGKEKTVMVTAKNVCEQLGITRRTLRNWERAGTINGIRMSSRKIRFNQADVTRLLTQGAFAKEEV